MKCIKELFVNMQYKSEITAYGIFIINPRHYHFQFVLWMGLQKGFEKLDFQGITRILRKPNIIC